MMAPYPIFPSSVLDRLFNDFPQEGTEPTSNRRYDLAHFRWAVRRDVEDVLNTRSALSLDIAQWRCCNPSSEPILFSGCGRTAPLAHYPSSYPVDSYSALSGNATGLACIDGWYSGYPGVHLKERGQDYDVMGWTQEQIIHDILDQYEKHLHFLHLVR